MRSPAFRKAIEECVPPVGSVLSRDGWKALVLSERRDELVVLWEDGTMGWLTANPVRTFKASGWTFL